MSSELPPSASSYGDAVFAIFNALRIIAHNSCLETTQFHVEDSSQGRLESLTSHQCAAEFDRHKGKLLISMNPVPEMAPGFERIRLVLNEHDFPQSPLFQSITLRADKLPFIMGSLIDFIRERALTPSINPLNGTFCGVITTEVGTVDRYICGLVEQVLQGIACQLPSEFQIVMRRTCLGTPPQIYINKNKWKISDRELDLDNPVRDIIIKHLTVARFYLKHFPHTFAIFADSNKLDVFTVSPMRNYFTGGTQKKAMIATAHDAYIELLEMIEQA